MACVNRLPEFRRHAGLDARSPGFAASMSSSVGAASAAGNGGAPVGKQQVLTGQQASPQQAQSQPAAQQASNAEHQALLSEAQRVGALIDAAHRELEEVKRLSRRHQGIFDDRASDIEKKQMSVKQNIADVGAAIAAMESRFVARATSDVDRRHKRTIVSTLNARLMGLTRDFKGMLELRSKTIGLQERRRRRFDQGALAVGAGMDELEGGDASAMLADDGTMLRTAQTSYHQSRADAVLRIQRMLGDLGTMFSKMGSIVAQHDEMILRIDNDMDDTVSNVQSGHQHLLTYFSYVSSNRRLILKVFAILVFFITFFVMFIA